ncbi:MAG: preprotein translocase subunit SecE [Actinobacteria bacterium]|nr:preprotein translocase subunit SecE [Actinomycetota bacterium]
MAKPVKVKKDQDPAPAKKGAKKAAPKSKGKDAPGKGVKEESKGLKGRLARTQAAKPAKGGKAKEKKGAVQFLREVRVEMSKVTWPSREELIQSTIVVLIAVAISGVFIAILDAIFSRLVGLVS